MFWIDDIVRSTNGALPTVSVLSFCRVSCRYTVCTSPWLISRSCFMILRHSAVYIVYKRSTHFIVRSFLYYYFITTYSYHRYCYCLFFAILEFHHCLILNCSFIEPFCFWICKTSLFLLSLLCCHIKKHSLQHTNTCPPPSLVQNTGW